MKGESGVKSCYRSKDRTLLSLPVTPKVMKNKAVSIKYGDTGC